MIGRICRIFAVCRERRQIPVGRQVCDTLLLLLFGVASGVFAKFLDTTPTNVLPRVLEVPDIRNVLGRFAVWALIALCIAVYSSRALRASLNVSVFFAGMLAGYYVYTAAAGEIVSVSYVMVWVGFTLLSLPLAALSVFAASCAACRSADPRCPSSLSQWVRIAGSRSPAMFSLSCCGIPLLPVSFFACSGRPPKKYFAAAFSCAGEFA